MHTYREFTTTPANLWNDLREAVLTSSEWSNPSGTLLCASANNGAQMNFDLVGGASIASNRIAATFWRSRNPATGVLGNSLPRELHWSRATDATLTLNSPIHVRVAAGGGLFYLDIEGPREGEAGASAGSLRNYLFAAPIQPYFDQDQPAVAVGAAMSTSDNRLTYPMGRVHVSVNRANILAWVSGKIFTLSVPGYDAGPANHSKWQPFAAGDGYTYLFPWVVVEDIDGIRGRLSDLYYGGVDKAQSDSVAGFTAGQVLGYRGGTYKLLRPMRNDGVQAQGGSFGYYAASGGRDQSPLVAARTTNQGITWGDVESLTWDQMAAAV